MPSLTIVSGPNSGDYYPLAKRTMVVGRDEACPVQIVDSRASRKHVQIRFDDTKNTHVALDMKSANGTLLNGRMLVTEVALVDGDEITVGESKIVYCVQEFPDKESALNHYKQRGQRGTPTIQQR
jgi:pSer/pThr/pTyr-binding forkhead associated (FHA) protein